VRVSLRICGALCAAAVAASAVIAASATAGPGLVAVQAAPAIPAGARAAGAVPGTIAFHGTVVIKPRDNAALQRFIAVVSDPRSPMFRHYLPAGRFGSHFGPLPATIAAVRRQLQDDGLRVSAVSSDGMLLRFTGTASTIERAFHTGLERYRLADGSVGSAATSAVVVPARIARSVTAVLGLNDLVRLQPAGMPDRRATAILHPQAKATRPRAGKTTFPHPAGSPKPCPAATAAASSFGGLTDDQIANSYGAFGLYGQADFGSGQHIALYELEPFLRSDIKTFDTCYFGAAQAATMLRRLHVIAVDGGQPTGTGSGEALLDVEDLEAIAPGASIDVYEAPSYGTDGTEYDPVDNYAAIVDADRDQVVSTSWGLCEQQIQAGQPGLQEAENQLFEQAAAQGQTVFAAAGDDGSDDCDGFSSTPVSGVNPLGVDDPGSQPYVLSAGGTSIEDAGQPPLERVWNDGGVGGAGGGGISQSWTMPAWQRNATVPGIPLPGSPDYAHADALEKSSGYAQGFCQSAIPGTSSTPCRVVPDVSAQADEYTGAITVYQAAFGGWGPTGGTSSATPISAALLALTSASSTCTLSPATRHGVGFAAPLLYAVASNPAEYRASFNDVTAGNNDVYGLENGLVFPARPGYDLASGLGSQRLTGPGGTAGLAFYLCGLATSTTRPVITGISPATGSIAGGQRVTITGRGFETGGRPDVATINVGNAQLTASRFTVHSPTSIAATMPPARDTRPPDAPAPQDGAGRANVIVVLTDRASSMPGQRSTFEYVDTRAGKSVPSVTGVIPVAGLGSAPTPVTILGSGFRGATRVTFGGVPATKVSILGPNRLKVTPPVHSSHTSCIRLPTGGVYAGENATNDICQVQVTVSDAHGASQGSRIRPPFEGPVNVDSLGVLVAPPGCRCETQEAPTEYDYLPAPRVTSVSTSAGPASLASEKGGTVITVRGAGLDPLTIDWASFGNPALESSMDTGYVFLTGTEMQIAAPASPRTVGTADVPLTVKTLAGQSGPLSVEYAGIPHVTGVVTPTNSARLAGVSGAPSTGRTPIRISGRGFAGQLLPPIQFADAESGGSLGAQFTFTAHGDTTIDTQTVQQNPGLVDVRVCTVTACSRTSSADRLWLYPPGDPTVNSVSPTAGPAAGGTEVTIAGQNLSCPLGAFFGSAPARSFSPVPTGLDCGSATALHAVTPSGASGRAVPVTVTTVESYFTGSGHGTSSASFKYK
jgi:hypothetical protein